MVFGACHGLAVNLAQVKPSVGKNGNVKEQYHCLGVQRLAWRATTGSARSYPMPADQPGVQIDDWVEADSTVLGGEI